MDWLICQLNTPPKKTLQTKSRFIKCKFDCYLYLCCCWLFSLLDWPSQFSATCPPQLMSSLCKLIMGFRKIYTSHPIKKMNMQAQPCRQGAHLPDPLPDQRLQVPPRRELPEQFAVSAGEQTVCVPRRSARQHNNDTPRSVRSARRQWRPAGGFRGGSASAAAGYGTYEHYDEWLWLSRYTDGTSKIFAGFVSVRLPLKFVFYCA